MRVLIDTNILLRSAQKKHPVCHVARRAIVSLIRSGHSLCLMPQNIGEFWNVCTRPTDVNGLGLSVEATDRYVDRIQQFATVLPDSLEVFSAWFPFDPVNLAADPLSVSCKPRSSAPTLPSVLRV